MAAPKRTKQQREEDLNRLATLYVKRVPQAEIARILDISQGQVSQDIKKLLQRWEDNQVDQITVLKNEQLATVRAIREEMWEQWELSKRQGKKSLVKSTSGEYKESKDGYISSTKLTSDGLEKKAKNWRNLITEDSARGDMEYMRGIMWTVQEESKLLGTYAPKKIANTNPQGDKEAGEAARRELLGLISGVAKRLTGEDKRFEKAIDVEHREIRDQLPELIKRERSKRAPLPLPSYLPIAKDDEEPEE